MNDLKIPTKNDLKTPINMGFEEGGRSIDKITEQIKKMGETAKQIVAVLLDKTEQVTDSLDEVNRFYVSPLINGIIMYLNILLINGVKMAIINTIYRAVNSLLVSIPQNNIIHNNTQYIIRRIAFLSSFVILLKLKVCLVFVLLCLAFIIVLIVLITMKHMKINIMAHSIMANTFILDSAFFDLIATIFDYKIKNIFELYK